MVATAAQRAGLVDVDLWVWASWSSTGYWPGLGGAAGRSRSMGSTRTCSWSLCRPRPRYAPAWWTWICVSGPAELDQDLQLVDVVATAAQRAGLDVDLHVWASWPSTRCWPGLQLFDVLATAALRAGLVVDLRVWAAPPAGTMLDQPAAARCGGHGRATRRPGCGSACLGQLVQHQVLARPGRRRRRPQLVDELDQDLQLVVVVATAALRACLVVDLRVWASWPSTRCWPGLQLLVVVATAAQRAGLVVALHVWASWPSLGRAAAPPTGAYLSNSYA
ncbi:hypothetical protein A4F85_01200 [Delftia sp. GW456-R20]|nr:hypothetical protein A4F85_01200 [Delftia sp. GW456-R20]